MALVTARRSRKALVKKLVKKHKIYLMHLQLTFSSPLSVGVYIGKSFLAVYLSTPDS